MLLSEYAVPGYLIRQGILSAQLLVEKGVVINRVTQHNRNFSVMFDREGYFLKQDKQKKGIGSVQYEATAYKILSSIQGENHLQSCLPAFKSYDKKNSVLTIELIDDGIDLFQFHTHYKDFPDSLALCAGKTLGYLHKIRPNMIQDNAEKELAILPVPDCFSLHDPEFDTYNAISRAGIELIKIIQGYPVFGDNLGNLSKQWSSSSLIHYDIKLSNFVVKDVKDANRHSLKLIDWEYLGFGDPYWDVGSMFSSYLHLWLSSSPLIANDSGNGFLAPSSIPLLQVQNSIRLFWKGYCDSSGLDSSKQDEWLIQAIKFCAARLIQTAFEHAMKVTSIDARITSLLQLGMNIFQTPEDSKHELFGITSKDDKVLI